MNQAAWLLQVVVWVCEVGACGFPPPADVGGVDGAVMPRCDPKANFASPVALSSLNADTEAAVADLSADELTIYFSSPRPGSIGKDDIYQATRTSTSMPFGGILPVSGVNTEREEREPRMTADGRSMFAISTIAENTGYHIMLTTRANTAVVFEGLQPLANVNSLSYNDNDPYILPTGNTLYFSSDRQGSGPFGLYRSSRTNSAFAAPKLISVAELASSTQQSPVVTLDELTLFFASNGSNGAGVYDIYEATRSSLADEFSAPFALTGVNTADIDLPTWISPDGCNLYITRFEAGIGRQLYVATRGP
jgi:hypothetical protein